MHKWIPTNNFLHKQGQADSPMCPHCSAHKESAEHIYQCPNNSASTECHDFLYETLRELQHHFMPQPILHTLEERLNNLLMVESRHKYTIPPNDWMSPAILTKAKHHQNIIGWDNFLRGYISKLWTNYNNTNDNIKGTNKWHDKLIPLMMKLHHKIWNGEAVNNKVKLMYQKPPKLAPRYQSILNTPLKQCLKHTTTS